MVAQTGGKLRRRRSTFQLGGNLENSLTAYAAAAAAAGVSLLALVAPAEARIVYTPAHTDIPVNGSAVPLDLNHDGIPDFSFVNSQTFSAHSHPRFLLVNGQTNMVWGRGSFTSRGGAFASALRKGFTIGQNKSYFQGARGVMAGIGATTYGFKTVGQWLYTAHRYLGLKFTINGHVHYGWARVAVTLSNFSIQATLTGYAYETVPNRPIVAGKTHGADEVGQPAPASLTIPAQKPVTLGLLALGAPRLSIWKREQLPEPFFP
jgi:hypothetical protein